jgi:PAS domain S-box-containing protein
MLKRWSEFFNIESTNERLVEVFSEDNPFADAFRCLFENASDAIYILDKNGNLTVNRKAEELIGFKREVYVEKSFRKPIPLKSLPKSIRDFVGVIRGKEARLELEIKRAANKTVLVEVTSRPLIIKGKNVGVLGIARDITERVQMENRLKEANRKLKMLFDTAMEGIAVVDEQENLTFVNRTFADMLGYEEDKLVGMNLQRFVDRQGFKEIRKQTKIRKKGKVSRYELAMFGKDGKCCIFHVSATPLWNEDGSFSGSLAIVMDVTERKRMEEKLREREEKFRKIFENANDGLIYLDTSGRILDLNEKAAQTFGGSKEEFLGKHFTKVGVFSLRDITKLLGYFARILRGKEGYTNIRIKNKKDQELYLECSSSIMRIEGKIVGILVVARDITERKKMEEKLRESEERWRSLVKNAPSIIMIVDREGKIQFINRTVIDASPEKVVGRSVYDFIDPRHHDVVRKTIRQVFETGEGSSYEIRGTGAGDHASWYATQVGPIKRDGQTVSVTLITLDITERKKVEEALRKSESESRTLLENLPQKIFFKDKNSVYISCNENYARDLKIHRDEIAGKTDYDFYPKKLAEKYRADDKRIMISGKAENIEEEYIQDGQEVFVHTAKTPVKDEKGNVVGILGIFWDITERKQMQQKIEEYSQQLEVLVEKRTRQLKEAQEQLIKSERLAAIGQVAAMVGHDIRNPLTGISSATYYLKTKLSQKMDTKSKEMLELIEKDIQYANKIIADLVEYSREMKLELTETTPKSIMKNALFLVKIPENVQIADLTQNKPKAKLDVDKMERVFSNLIKNAVDAMPEGGKIAISSKESDGNVEIMFVDNGIGMAKEVLERIWTPFFTTKARGMGLGLPICKRIVEAHGGNISAESVVGKGSMFTVTLPIELKTKEKGGKKVWVNVQESLLSTTTKA